MLRLVRRDFFRQFHVFCRAGFSEMSLNPGIDGITRDRRPIQLNKPVLSLHPLDPSFGL